MVGIGESPQAPIRRWTPKHGLFSKSYFMVKISGNKLIIEMECASPAQTLYDLQRSLLHLLMLKDSRQNTDGFAEWNTISLLDELQFPKSVFEKAFC